MRITKAFTMDVTVYEALETSARSMNIPLSRLIERILMKELDIDPRSINPSKLGRPRIAEDEPRYPEYLKDVYAHKFRDGYKEWLASPRALLPRDAEGNAIEPDDTPV
jgi:hypothetical protein